MAEDKIAQQIDNMMKNLEEKTGKSVKEWINIVNSSGLSKHGEIVNMLKTKHGLTHGYANMVVHKAKESDAGSADAGDLVSEMFKGKDELFGYYEKIMAKVKAFGGDVEVSPKKAYVSLRRKKQFALIQPSTKTRLDVGINLKGVKPEGNLEAAGSFNAMCTHRVRVENDKAIDKNLFKWLKDAYNQAG